ncbi:MAG: hypothetical protein ACRC8S_21150 [Fimbriiglobus sp.]
MMPVKAIICGALLITIGVNAYLNGTPNPETGAVSPTALIPAYFGGALALMGALGFIEGLRKHVMHLAAMVGLFGLLGGFAPIIRALATGKELDFTAPAIRNGLMMTVICAAFVYLCVMSFRDARKAREAKAAAVPST